MDTPLDRITQSLHPIDSLKIPKITHQIWIGDTLDQSVIADIHEFSRLTEGFQHDFLVSNKSIFKNAEFRMKTNVDLASASERSGIVLDTLENFERETKETPLIGFTHKEMNILWSRVYRQSDKVPASRPPQASDILRYMKLHRDGGLYVDCDFSPHADQDKVSPTDAQKNAQAKDSLSTSWYTKFVDFGENSEDPIPQNQKKQYHENIQLEKLDDIPQNRYGFVALGVHNKDFNNSIIASAPATEENYTQLVTYTALKAILKQEEEPLNIKKSQSLSNSKDLRLSLRQRFAVFESVRRLKKESDKQYAEKPNPACTEDEMERIDAHKGTYYNMKREDMIRSIKYAKIDKKFALGMYDIHECLRAKTAVTVDYLVKTIVLNKLLLDRKIGISWELERLRPQHTAEFDAIRRGLITTPIPSIEIGTLTTGVTLLKTALYSHPEIRAQLRARVSTAIEMGQDTYDAYRAAERYIAQTTQPDHPFFHAPPCDSPTVYALESLRHAESPLN
jgi:hypothetical protein